MNNELIVEHLGFAPVHVVDKTLDAVNQTLYKAMGYFEQQIENDLGVHETEKCMQHLETLFERSIDSKFDRFELYVLNNILTFPADRNVVLPHYAGLNLTVTNHDEALLDRELDTLRVKRVAQRYIKEKMEQKQRAMRKRLQKVKALNSSICRLEEIAKENKVYPMTDQLDMEKRVFEMEAQMNSITDRAGDLEWSSVPLIGSDGNSSKRKNVQEEILEYLGNPENTVLSSWEIAKEFRDAIAIGSINKS